MTDRLDEILAYIDGEMPAAARAAFEADMAASPDLADEVAAHRALGSKLSSAYAPALDEPVPLSLTLAAQAANDATRRPAPWAWAGMAASLVVGVLAGRLALAPEPALSVGSEVPARLELASALDRQLTADPGTVRIGLTFRDHAGRLCRTFRSTPDRAAGLACRADGAWRLETATAWQPSNDPTYRTAGSDTPSAVLMAVDQALAGQVFDAQQEKAARDAGWR